MIIRTDTVGHHNHYNGTSEACWTTSFDPAFSNIVSARFVCCRHRFSAGGERFFLFGNCLYYRSSNVQSLAKQKYHYNPLYMGIQLHPHPRKKHDPHNENRLSGCWRLLAAVGCSYVLILAFLLLRLY